MPPAQQSYGRASSDALREVMRLSARLPSFSPSFILASTAKKWKQSRRKAAKYDGCLKGERPAMP
jgi:hypothetical protein